MATKKGGNTFPNNGKGSPTKVNAGVENDGGGKGVGASGKAPRKPLPRDGSSSPRKGGSKGKSSY